MTTYTFQVDIEKYDMTVEKDFQAKGLADAYEQLVSDLNDVLLQFQTDGVNIDWEDLVVSLLSPELAAGESLDFSTASNIPVMH